MRLCPPVNLTIRRYVHPNGTGEDQIKQNPQAVTCLQDRSECCRASAKESLYRPIIDRAVANARAIRGAPEAIAVAGIIAVGMSYFGFQHYRERLADLKERLASQDRLLTEYRAKLSGANPEEAATQIEQLTAALAAAEKRLKPRTVKRHAIGTPDRQGIGTPHGRWGRLVPVANRRVPRASRSALTSDGAARVGGACLPTGASRGGTQPRFLIASSRCRFR